MALFGRLYSSSNETQLEVDDRLLNVRLYKAMLIRFGTVRVAHRGEPLCGDYVTDLATGRNRLSVYSRGETYTTDCPFCGDGRGRLWVNHTFGTVDAVTGGRRLEMWKCYKMECQARYENRIALEDMILDAGSHLPGVKIDVVRDAPRGLEECEFPGRLIPVDQINPVHAAATYLDSRHFDRKELSAVWGVSLATNVPVRVRGSASEGRIIIPVRRGGKMVGWQARYPGDVDWKKADTVKYLTYFPKSMAIYGIDEAEDAPYLVLTEGATDVWRFGTGAVCPFGKSLSPMQAEIVATRLRDRVLVLVPDQDDPESMDGFINSAKLVNRFQSDKGLRRSPIGMAVLPPGEDPASVTRTVLRAACAAAAADPVWTPSD